MTAVSASESVPVLVMGPPVRPVPAATLVTVPAALVTEPSWPSLSITTVWVELAGVAP